MKEKAKINSGIYLVIDPSMEESTLLESLEKAISAKPCALQIWDNFPSSVQVAPLICKIKEICRGTGIPILMNNHPEWAELFDMDGIHFDELSPDHTVSFPKLKQQGKLIGVTINNDLNLIKAAIRANVDYLSFCSMFPSSTANSCDLVEFETVQKTRKLTSIPIFLAGGITTQRIEHLKPLEFDGIAVVSGVMKAADPETAISQYKQLLTDLKK
ncbi:thiamine phosphate synthase [Algoriphagus winogradskyi]|uniref:Thiamine-phosphate pyrophosphorylase n=1 Tax=Algoriphagus winogradskyi TaxID=237017 RepID=A0ABY1NKZ2_9BACT|nr:thiamine phosphate synthase [Algoriphagus winogradskyi]SMP12441.1 thiamine-phosphate pyrophosphorylase [Algoriphagus winogradskyi]